MRAKWLWFLAGLLLWSGAGGAAANPGPLEDLRYQVGLGPLDGLATVHLVFEQTGPNRYQADFSCVPQGRWGILRRWLPERYHTEMAYRQGRLQPQLYREELQIKGEHVVKEYRFDYQNGQLEYWRQAGNREMVKERQFPLEGAVYDPLTLIYNVRLGAWGLSPNGETLRVRVIPNPEPEEMVIRIGPETPQGCKAMLTLREIASGKEGDSYFIDFTPERVPRLVWTRVLEFGRLGGRLQNPGAISREGILAPPRGPGK
jgi:hypothetical protein